MTLLSIAQYLSPRNLKRAVQRRDIFNTSLSAADWLGLVVTLTAFLFDFMLVASVYAAGRGPLAAKMIRQTSALAMEDENSAAVAVVVSATFWTALWGPIGLVLATPLTVCLVVLGRRVERLALLDVMFGDRPALSPAEIFYQRMLAGDPTNSFKKAENSFKERSLSSYYDEVAIKGLQARAGWPRSVMPLGYQTRLLKSATRARICQRSVRAD